MPLKTYGRKKLRAKKIEEKPETQEETMFTKKSKKELRDTWAYGLESCHNCDDESCDDNLNRIESATTIHASQPPKVEGSEGSPGGMSEF